MDIYDEIRQSIKNIEPTMAVYDNVIPETVETAIGIRSITNNINTFCGEEAEMLSILCKGEAKHIDRLMFKNIQLSLNNHGFVTKNFAYIDSDEQNKMYYEFTLYK